MKREERSWRRVVGRTVREREREEVEQGQRGMVGRETGILQVKGIGRRRKRRVEWKKRSRV